MKIMQIAVWHPDYETGNLLIDEQHKTLFKIVNDLADATARNARREVLRQILNELINEVDIHFKDEE
jgi:hemerythrin-like metal-binding protein